MNYLPVAILAYFLNAVAVTTDKFLLNKFIPDPLVYVFYFSVFSLVALFLIPFTHIPQADVFFIASSSTILWTLGAYFMFKALKMGQVSRVIPIIGALTSLILFFQASISASITINQTWAVGFLIFGLIFLILDNLKGKFHAKELVFEVLASFLFAISYILLREAYLKQDFLTVLVWSRIILLPLGIGLLIIPLTRRRIFNSGGLKINFRSKLGAFFLGGQFAGGSSQLLLTYAISLAVPALVNSLQGIQYIFLMVFSLVLANKFPSIFKEKSSLKMLVIKLIGIFFIAMGLFILNFSTFVPNLKLGITYSPVYAYQLGLNPRITYIKMLDELKPENIRLPVYWDEVEQFPLQFSFINADYYIYEAQKRNVKVIPVLGYRVPRWPECYAPEWVQKATIAQRQDRTLRLVREEVNHFKTFPNIVAWQIENEPFLPYGKCDKITSQTKETVEKEVNIVKSLDKRPVLISDSGELSSWANAFSLGDIFGFTVYRQVWNNILGQIQYPIPPFFYTLKADFTKLLTHNPGKEAVIVELQAEPWMPDYKDVWEVSPNQQAKILPLPKMASNIAFAKETGVKQAYLWGVEWWYFMAKHNHPEYLEYAKTLFKP